MLAHQRIVILAGERPLEGQRGAVTLEHAALEQVQDESRQHRFGHRGHVVVVRIRLVPFGHRELGIVESRQSLVAKVMADLVHLLQPADETALQVQFVGNAQIERGVERLVMGLEGRGRRAPVQRLQHRRFHLQIPLAVEERPNALDDPRPQPEHLPDLRMHREVRVPLAVA